MKKFDLKKMIAENKATFFSSLNEGEKEPYSGKSDSDFYSDIQNQYKHYKTGTYDKLKNKEYYKDAEADDAEHIKALEKDMEDDKKSSKMKVSELKAKIKEMIVAEMDVDNDDMENAPESEVDFLAELEEMLSEADEKTDADTGDDVTAGDSETIDTVTTDEVDPDVKAVQDALTQAQAAAQKLGDKKLTDQIGNTITFFTRSHVVEKPETVA